jgi:nitrogen fixation/metabolism regulation signal transduction histidine kinase
MKKHIPAFLAAFLMTAFVALAMGVVTVNAFVNKDSAPVANAQTTGSTDQAQIAQLQSLVQQYQDREQQYQQREQQYQQMIQDQQAQLDAANQQIDQFKQFVLFLQSRGIVTLDNQGRVSLNSP